ncbi:30S ribosomal protein S15 [Buchnera aphidicola str. Ak (Acyrthosiphon kondoi)]|uniref:Small ribosomal subunit protein uS15 n=1 Tax=Buchnera aphidicola str. Ak (Acyrthosiphon kondoi) TaxID=1005090 RepID=G2LN82_9GAMM|nr:30S ribosomal protein S15 [Buchnera aphidicola]AEO08720.1 30S ribosomal protein S15 [Buchnera aphidicola str. Ak (Acyrthosiphon kondoi)]WAI18472.1 MAG: 30S ribosomal protein S15 [Buchnera aphidicola (Acyrthosiphon caraganae)]
MSLSLTDTKKIILKYGKSEKNSGITEVQVVLLTNQINHLQTHFSQHKKDHCSRRGLLNMVSKRRKLLDYLKKKNISRYTFLIEDLHLRR